MIGLVLEGTNAYLATDDLSAHKVALVHTQAHLLEEEVDFFSLLHGAVRLHLQVLHDRGRLVYVALRLLDARYFFGETCPLNLHVDLARRHSPQCVNELELLLHVIDLVHVGACLLHHFGHRLSKYTM